MGANMILRIFLSIWIAIIAMPAFALDPGSVGDRLIAEWQGWMKKHRITEGSIILAHNGVVIREFGIKRSVDDPAKVASLSKAITAVCALKASESAGKTLKASLSVVLPAALGKHRPKDAGFPEITIGQLITHTSGITSTYHRRELAKLRSFTKENKLWQFSKIVKEPLSATPGTASYAYSNANYLILGLVIEEMTGEGYEDYCKRAVLDPIGASTAKLNDKWRVMTSWGGWEISARDYLNFAQTYFGGEYRPNAPAGFTLPYAPAGRGRAYAAGVLYRNTGQGINAWHQGSWRGVRGRANDQFGAYVALYANGFSVVTNYSHDAWEGKIRDELDTLLYQSTHP